MFLRIIFLMKIPIALLLVSLAWSQAVLPSPHCKFRPLFSTLPLTPAQILTGDLTTLSTGYNMQYKVRTGSDIASVPSKLTLNDYLNHNFTVLISHFVEHKGNKWGTHMHFLVEEYGMYTYLYRGVMKDHDKTPDIEAVVVEVSKEISCFDVVVFPDVQVGLVDCVKVNGTKLQNLWLYVDLVKGEVTKTIPNQMYVPFRNITKRRVLRMHDPNTGYQYVLRAYLAGGVDADNIGNTYLQIFSAADPTDLQIMKVIDRSYLGTKSLAITDFKIYLGDIFVLDYLYGLYRLDITKGQHVTITGRYVGDTFLRFSVYSDDLDEQVIVALANSHAVYEVNWDKPSKPYLVGKYSLMLHSHIQDIVISRQYVIVQASANATADNGSITVNYTWIFGKNTRSYMNAFKVIDHATTNVFIDLDRYTNTLMVTSDTGIGNYQINDPILTFQQPDSTSTGKNFTVLVQANSTDPHSLAQIICTFRSTVYIVSPDNMTIWPTGLTVPQQYYANFPGYLQIFLSDYVLGPNISFALSRLPPNPLPTYYLNQQNISTVEVDKPPTIGEIRFFHTDVVPHYGNDTIIYYYQDVNNITHVASCFHERDGVKVDCRVVQEYSFRGRIGGFASAVFADQRGFNEYWYAYMLENMRNVVFVVDYIRHIRLATIQLEAGMEGEITNLATSNGYLYLTIPKIKTIYAYKLSQCSEFECKRAFTIDSKVMKALGVAYFSPKEVITTREHPQVMFIKTIGSLVVLDVDNNNNLVLLSQIFSPAIRSNTYKVAVNKNSLVIVSSTPNLIQQYDLREMYTTRRIIQQKNLNLYSYVISNDFDLEFSDVGDLFYINTVDTRTNSTTVLIYRTSNFAVASLYDVINLPGSFNHSNLEIEVSGYEVDFVSIIYSGYFTLYRQYQWPHFVMKDPNIDTSFQISFSNTATRQNLTNVTLHIANYPQHINSTKQFQNSKKQFKVAAQSMVSTFDTSKWFTGHVLRYNHTCTDCESNKIRVQNPVSYMRRLQMKGTDYAETFRGGILLWDDLFRMHTNGSVRDVILLPDQKMDEQCLRVVSRNDDSLIITGCEVFGWGANLYLTSLAGEKAFTWGPFRTSALYLRNMELVHNILMIVDVDFGPQRRYRSGGVYLYAADIDPLSENDLEELDYIDSNDFQAADGWDADQAYVANAQLVYDTLDDSYRLYVSEVSNGFFVLDFKYAPGSREIQVLTSNYIDMNKLLKENNLHMPKDAYFLALALVGWKYNPGFEMESIVLTTNGFHDFEITLAYDDDGRILSKILHRVYYRYAYYESNNYVRASGGYLAKSYIAPYDRNGTTKQIIAVFDTTDYPNDAKKGYSERYMLGAHIVNHTDHSIFAFNSTYDPQSNGTRHGLVVIDPRANSLSQLRVSRNLTVQFLDQSILDQKITLTPYNDFSSLTFDIEVTNPHPSPEPDDGGLSLTVEIILLIVAFLTVVGFIGYLVLLFCKKPLSQLEKSLVEDPEPVQRREGSVVINSSEQQEADEGEHRRYEAPPVQVYEEPASLSLEEKESVVEPPRASGDDLEAS